MADRYDDYDRGRDPGQRFDERRRESRGRGSLLGGRDYENDREEGGREFQRNYGEPSYGGRSFSRQGSERDERDWRRENWGYGEERGYGGGIGGQDWRTGRYGGGLGFGREERGQWGEPWGRDRDWRTGEDWSRGREGYGRGASRSEWGQTFGGLTSHGPGRFAGRGPKGYRRSDDRIREEICERLTQHPDIDASDMEIQVVNAEVILLGTVEDRNQKRMAEDIAESVSGVQDVRNDLKIPRGLGERIGEALGLSGGREQERRTTGQQQGTSQQGTQQQYGRSGVTQTNR
jgi:hypothetical protein